MKTVNPSVVRAALTAVASLVFSVGLLPAGPQPFTGSFTDTCLVEWLLDEDYTPGVRVNIASSGWVSCMHYPVSSLTIDQVNNLSITDRFRELAPGTGYGTYILREPSGDAIFMEFRLVGEPPGAHPIMFHGTFAVTGGTGRFAGATGSAEATGWADFDSPQALTAKGGWEFNGTIVLPTADLSACLHVSSRAHVGSGEQTHIVGLEVSSSVPRAYLIRGVGPTLASYGLTGALVDPVVTVYNGANQVVGANDDWSAQTPDVVSAIRAATAAVGAFTLSDGSKDAALLLALPAGSYTVHLAGKDGGTGIGLVEILEIP